MTEKNSVDGWRRFEASYWWDVAVPRTTSLDFVRPCLLMLDSWSAVFRYPFGMSRDVSVETMQCLAAAQLADAAVRAVTSSNAGAGPKPALVRTPSVPPPPSSHGAASHVSTTTVEPDTLAFASGADLVSDEIAAAYEASAQPSSDNRIAAHPSRPDRFKGKHRRR